MESRPSIHPAQMPPPKADGSVVRAAGITVMVAAAFCVLVALAMIIQELRSTAHDPTLSPQLIALKQQLLADPKNEPLKEQIRALDLQLRRQYFRGVTLNDAGAWLLAMGVLTLLLAAKYVRRQRATPPMPGPPPDAEKQAARVSTLSRWAVAAGGATVALALLILSLTSGTALPTKPADWDKLLQAQTGGGAAGTVVAGPAPEEIQNNWPQFRGPGGNGLVRHTNVPLTWDVATGANIAWKTPVPSPGFNSPIIWGNRIFFSGGNAAKREVMCFDLQSGQLLWQRAVENVPNSPAQLPEIPEQTGFAAPTMATDGQRAYVIFANGDVAAFDFNGNQVWAQNLGVPHNPHGHASSLATWQNRLIVQLDQANPDERLSKLYALDGATGKPVWQRTRPVGDSWASPIVIEAAGKTQIIALGLPWLIAHDAKDGNELWRAECLEGEVTPSPVFVSNRLYVVNPNIYLLAIRPDGQGNVTESHIAWKAEDGIPDITSPVSNGELVFLVSTYGVVTCYEAKDGKKVWEHDYETDVNASPVIAGNRLFVCTVEGTGIVLEVGREFKELASSRLGERVHASPAFVADRMVLRGVQHLYGIGPKTGKLAQQQ